MSHPAPLEQYLHYGDISIRMASFLICPISIGEKEEMVKRGFYYAESENVIKCSFCTDFKCSVDSNEHEGHACPKMEAKKDNSNASAATPTDTPDQVICDARTRTEEPSAESIDDQKAQWPFYATYIDRLHSFLGWQNKHQKPEELCLAGLFYTGCDDRTRCFHCGISMRNWLAGDDPWVEHARSNPECNFVLKIKGKEFVDKAWDKTFDNTPEENIEETFGLLKDLIRKLDPR